MAKMACAKCGMTMKKGGAKPKKMATGGPFGKGDIPLYDNNPRTQQGRMLKNGGIKKAAYGMAMDSTPMTNTTVAKPKKPRVGKVTDKARVGMAITNAPVKHNPPVGKRHNASHTGYVPVSQKRSGGMTKKKTLKKASDGISVTDPPASTNTQGPSAAKDFIPASSGNLPVRGPHVSYSRNDLPFVNAGTIGLNGQPIGQVAANAINRQMRIDSAAGRDVTAPFQRRGGSTKTKMAKGGATKKKMSRGGMTKRK